MGLPAFDPVQDMFEGDDGVIGQVWEHKQHARTHARITHTRQREKTRSLSPQLCRRKACCIARFLVGYHQQKGQLETKPNRRLVCSPPLKESKAWLEPDTATLWFAGKEFFRDGPSSVCICICIGGYVQTRM